MLSFIPVVALDPFRKSDSLREGFVWREARPAVERSGGGIIISALVRGVKRLSMIIFGTITSPGRLSKSSAEL